MPEPHGFVVLTQVCQYLRMSYVMPPEWEPHARTWMALPPPTSGVSTLDPEAWWSWIDTANAVAEFEPVAVLVDATDVARARSKLTASIELVEARLDDGWFRDSGPTFVRDHRDHSLAAVHWTFNGWGEMQAYDWDALIGGAVGELAGVPVIASSLVNEGGGICTDGEGTVIVTETVQLHDRRNPRWSKEQVEDELRRTIGATTVIWLERGLMGDMQEYRPGVGTNGHVDVLAAFVRPGVVVVHGQSDPAHHDHAVMAENVRRLRAAEDASGRSLEVVPLEAPKDFVVDGISIDHSYINFSFVNDGVVMSTYSDPVADDLAMGKMRELFPDRSVVGVDARPIFRNGGGVHCITQQQPV
jgi:agmatine deiminase